MGSNAITSITFGIVLMAGLVYFAPDSSRTIYKLLTDVGVPEKYLNRIPFFASVEDGALKTEEQEQKKETLLTPEQLKAYDGSPESKGLYLAILGEVFDVEKGAQHYKPGGGYAFFSGRDASRAYITGDFTESSLVDDVSDLDAKSLASIEDWLSFYRDEYKVVGKVIGRYYDETGSPTKELLAVREKIAQNLKNKYLEDKEKENFPPCNSEWSKEKGSRVWCTSKSGGVQRMWVGVPREFHTQGKDPRCVCIKNYGPPSSNPDAQKHSDRGDLDHPDLKEYPNCPPKSDSCNVAHP